MARRGIDSDTSLDLDDNQLNHQGRITILSFYCIYCLIKQKFILL